MAVCNSCGNTCEAIKLCSNCKSIAYCSRDCQRKDWQTHKLSCQSTSKLVWQRPGVYHHIFRKVRLHPSPTIEHDLAKLRTPPQEWWVCWCRDGVDEQKGTVDVRHRPAGDEVLVILPIARRHLSSAAGSSHAVRIASSPFPFRNMSLRVLVDVHGEFTELGRKSGLPAANISIQAGDVPNAAILRAAGADDASVAAAHNACDTKGCEGVALFAGNAVPLSSRVRLRPLPWTGGRAGLVGLGDSHTCGEVRLEHLTVLPVTLAAASVARLAGWDTALPRSDDSGSDDEQPLRPGRGPGAAAVRAAADAAAAAAMEFIGGSAADAPTGGSDDNDKEEADGGKTADEEPSFVRVHGSPRVLSAREATQATAVAAYIDGAQGPQPGGIGLPVRVVKNGVVTDCSGASALSAIPHDGPPLGPTGGIFGEGDPGEIVLFGVIVRGLTSGPDLVDVEQAYATESLHSIHVQAMKPEEQDNLQVPALWRAFASVQEAYLAHPSITKHVLVPEAIYVDPLALAMWPRPDVPSQ